MTVSEKRSVVSSLLFLSFSYLRVYTYTAYGGGGGEAAATLAYPRPQHDLHFFSSKDVKPPLMCVTPSG